MTNQNHTYHESFVRENIYIHAIESSSNHIIITDINGIIMFANKAAQATTGYTFEEMQGKTPRLWGGCMDTAFYRELWRKIKQDKQTFTGEIINKRKDGRLYTAYARISPIFDHEQNLIGFIGTEEDISERIRLEKELKDKNVHILQEKRKDEAILLSIGDGVVAVDRKGVVEIINPAALSMFGLEKEEIMGKKYVDIVDAEDEQGISLPAEKRPVTEALYSGQPIRKILVYTRKDGTKFIADTINTPLSIDDVLYGSVLVFRNVTSEKQIDKAKTEFISLASHQLRTPLSTINWYIEMLLAGDGGTINDRQKMFLLEAYGGSRRMVALVNALLNVSRIESNSYMVNPVPVDAVALIKSVIDEIRPKIESKKLQVTFEKEDIPIISLDPDLATIIFQNLITNAVKYTGEAGWINIAVSCVKKGDVCGPNSITEDSLLVEVRDNGMGIPRDEQSHVFSKLFRARNAQEMDVEGTGLGLYLIKGLIERSHGHIWFTSEEDKGSSFFVVLPFSGMVKKKGTKKLDK